MLPSGPPEPGSDLRPDHCFESDQWDGFTLPSV